VQPNCTRAIGPFRLLHDLLLLLPFCVRESDRDYRSFSGFAKGRYDAEKASSYAQNAALVGPQSNSCPEAIHAVPAVLYTQRMHNREPTTVWPTVTAI
jgi:hypothetical protein